MGKIKLAIVGVGNCASSLVQGLQYYRKVDGNSPPTPGLMHNVVGGYRLADIEVVAAFDVDKRKVGKDVGKAIFADPNCTIKFSDVSELGVDVQKGPVLDGVGETMRDSFAVDTRQRICNVKEVLKKSGAEVVVSYLPVGSDQATRFYANEVLAAGCGFINAIPSFVASAEDGKWAKRFEAEKLPIIGDDVKSQVGATILHRILTRLFMDRGVKLERTYQLNVGGNTDFRNMLDRTRLKSKKISKTESVQSQMNKRLPDENIHIGPSDYVPWLHDKKLCFIRMEGRNFGDVPLLIDLKLDVEDSPNSAGIMVDAIRCVKLALDREVGGVLYSPSAYFMKHPAVQYPDSVARQMVEEFISGKREK
ncbi:MAG: inositol-3-phosphate synthase [Candidatus Burarchaeum sp.]|nr:inositol-3-phosphate synthase [Candidatus Burarchaeum sp.]MDO8340268.1 inositol-3-phosphate synthase [Candidatus Burarchaeum sp.]